MVANMHVTIPVTCVSGSPSLIISTVFGTGVEPVFFIMVWINCPAVLDEEFWPINNSGYKQTTRLNNIFIVMNLVHTEVMEIFMHAVNLSFDGNPGSKQKHFKAQED